jgi:hypothetical protein
MFELINSDIKNEYPMARIKTRIYSKPGILSLLIRAKIMLPIIKIINRETKLTNTFINMLSDIIIFLPTFLI